MAEFSDAFLHHGEEPPISGLDPYHGGSGTIFFTRCNLHCVFCQNWQISQMKGDVPNTFSGSSRRKVTPEALAAIMLEMQAQGALNINLVSPTPYVHQIIQALHVAKDKGLNLPIVYNSGGYDSLEALRLLDGLVDIYMPDAKMAPADDGRTEEVDTLAARLLGAGDYSQINRAAIHEMFRQVGHLAPDSGPARRGLLIRHLVMPENLARTDRIIPWLADNFGPKLYLNLMAQYRPMYLLRSHPEEFSDLPGLFRPLRRQEYEKAVVLACDYGLTRSLIQ